MPRPWFAQCRHRFVAIAMIPAFLAAPAFAGEIFKCVAKDGSPLYQNFPCQYDSINWVPSNLDAMKAIAKPSDASQSKSKSSVLNVASTNKSVNASGLRIGMTADEVRAVAGEPEEMVDDEPTEGGRVSLWRYAEGRSVQFDHKHHVMEIQQR